MEKYAKLPWAICLWKTKAPRRSIVHSWKCFSGGLLTLDALQHRGVSFASRCVSCYHDCENSKHILFTCDFAKEICSKCWNHPPSSLFDLLRSKDSWEKSLSILILEALWRERNLRIFKGRFSSLKQVTNIVLKDLSLLS